MIKYKKKSKQRYNRKSIEKERMVTRTFGPRAEAIHAEPGGHMYGSHPRLLYLT